MLVLRFMSMAMKSILSYMLSLRKMLSRICMNSTLHEMFEDLKCISRLNPLHESFSTMILVNFGTNLTFIGSVKRELEPFWQDYAKTDLMVLHV